MSDTEKVFSYPFGEPEQLLLHPDYAKMQALPGLARVKLPYGREGWLATKYEDVHKILTDTRFSRELAIANDEPRMYPGHLEMGMLDMDPPAHTRIRQIVASAFTPRRTEQLRPRAVELADDLIDTLLAGPRPADLVEGFTRPLPVVVISEMFGLPTDDRAYFAELAEAVTTTTRLTPEQIGEYLQQLWDYLAGVIAQRRKEPQDDALTALVQASDSDQMTEHEIAQIAAGQLAASYETTANELASFFFALLHNPEQMDHLWMNPSMIKRAVEELLRFCPMSSASLFARYATEDVVIGGTLIRAGEQVLASLIAANKDETVYQDPGSLNLNVERKPHLAFGSGVHRCLGTGIARMVLQVGLSTIVRRMPGLRLAIPESELEWRTEALMRGLKHIPVTW
ncbi:MULTISPECIES: cytochrome P450 [Amycolatopsis]|uniref:Cytochrome P450 n=1 Tax=Amycolatopsis albidoflavus TaxID=102226 RepID=A0ABW5I927_9PSEU